MMLIWPPAPRPVIAKLPSGGYPNDWLFLTFGA